MSKMTSILSQISEKQLFINFTATPGQPGIPFADSVGATSISIHWNSPSVVQFPVSYYLVNASSLNNVAIIEFNTTTNITSFNVTGLLPGTTYELTVMAVSQGGDVIARSQASHSLTATTTVTGIQDQMIPAAIIVAFNIRSVFVCFFFPCLLTVTKL